MHFPHIPMFSTLRQSTGRLFATRYGKAGLAVGVAVLLVGALVAVNPGPRRVGTTAGTIDDGSGRASGDGSTQVSTVDPGAPGSVVPPGAPGSLAPAGVKGAGKAAKKGVTATGKKAAGAAASSGGATSVGGDSGGGIAGGDGGSAGTTADGSSDGGAAATGGATGGGTGGDGGAGGAAAPGPCGFAGCERAQGVTDNQILLGVPWQDPRTNQAEYADNKFPIHFGDVEKMGRAMEADINRRNPTGINGRKVKVVFYPNPNNPEQAPPGESEAQAETRTCVKFAEDLKVFAVVTHWMGRAGAQCLADRRVLLFRTGQLIGDDAVLKQIHPWVWTSAEKSNNRLWATLVPALKEQGYFDRRSGEAAGIKVGIVLQEDGAYTRVRDLIIQKLKEAGHSDIEVFSYGVTGQTFDFAALAAAGSSAAHKFRASGVNRVLFVPGFLAPIFFMNTAEGDGSNPYRPRYAVDTTMVLNGPIEKGVPPGSSKPQQLNGAMGIGWKNQSDMSGTGAGAYSAREQQCAGAMARGGVNVVDRTNPVLAMQLCETFWAFEEAAKGAGRGLNAGSLVGGAQALGGSWESIISYGVDFAKAAARGTGDASFAHRWIQYNFAEKRFVYSGGVRPDR